MTKINKSIFEKKLNKKINQANLSKMEFIELNAGEFHREVGVYPSPNHSMPTCCDVMRARMKDNDDIISSPQKGRGASLTIRYYL